MQGAKNTVLAFFFLAIGIGAYANMAHLRAVMAASNLAIAVLATMGAMVFLYSAFRR